MAERTDLLIIDPQNDFCSPDANAKAGTSQEGNGVYEGTLYVPGAEKDMERVASLIDRCGSKIKNIHVTMDCHHWMDVAHAAMWRDSDGNPPAPFTIITSQEMRDGKWTPVLLQYKQRFIDYCEALEASGKFPLCIWPPHGLIGSLGNAVFPILFEALKAWELKTNKNVNYVSKGSNPFTEHYSAVRAEVVDPEDPTTQLNTPLIKVVADADITLIAGEAGSHCVKETVGDIADGFGDDSLIKKLKLLTNAVSPVISPFVDFPAVQAQFIADLTARGMQTALTTDF